MRIRLAIIFISSLLLFITLSFSQDSTVDNLLANGDFEDVFVVLDGEAPRNVAQFWMPWHVAATGSSPSFANHNPNYDVETARIRLDDAGKAQKYFTLFSTHQGGIYQRVDSLTSGTTFRFSIYAYVWSSSFEDTEVSEDPGDVVVRVGIDPTGGTDGASADIIWSTAATFFYDAYRQYAVIATAESSSITVFVESTVGEPRANNYIYLDDAVLEVASESVVLVEQTPTSETNTGLANETALPTATPPPTDVAPTVMPTVAPLPTDTPAPTATSTPSPTPTMAQAATAEATFESDDFPDIVAHVVVADDTLSGLAFQYSSTVNAIRRANDLGTSSLIVVGQRLLIPVNPPPVTPATATPSPTYTATPTATPTATATPITYQVLPGDTLVNIAAQYGTTVDLLAQINNIPNPHQIDVGQIVLIPTAIPPTVEAVLRPTVTLYPTATQALVQEGTTGTGATIWYFIYVVQVGDTLDEIAREHNTTIAELVSLNDIENPRRIVPGQQIKVPTGLPTPTPEPTFTPLPTTIPVTYIVQQGDSFAIIAGRYGVSAVELAQVNGLDDNAQLTAGQVIIIPG